MSKEQIDIALKGGDVDNPTGDLVFGMVKSNYYKWPNGIVPYVLADSVSKCTLNHSSTILLASTSYLIPKLL